MDKEKKRYSRSIRDHRDRDKSADHSPEREGGRDGDSKRRNLDNYHHERSHGGSKEREARSKRKGREEENGAREGNKKSRLCGERRRRRSRFEDESMEFVKKNAQVSEGSVSKASETSSQISEAVKRAQMGQAPTETVVAVEHKPTMAHVLRVDALGREIDEQGCVIISVTKPSNLATLKVNLNKHKKDAFQFLKPHQLEVDPQENHPHFDPRMGNVDKNKSLRPKRMSFQFVEQGKWTRDVENSKLKCHFGEAKARELKLKQVHLTMAKDDHTNPNLIELSERVPRKEEPIADHVEWWDANILTNGTITESHLKIEKLTHYIEHPRPIEPPAEAASPPPQPLKLTKKEQKKLRTLRRVAKEKEKQEMIRQGLLEPPKAKVKMSNLMKILASEATQDPTRVEKEIRTAAAEREQAHTDRNAARKLTSAEKREKKERKLFDDPTTTAETIVSVYKIKKQPHPKTRFKVEMNARQNILTGCSVMTDGMSVVVVEGKSKTIKRYAKLMLKRINWKETEKNEEDEEEEESGGNKCCLVWQRKCFETEFS